MPTVSFGTSVADSIDAVQFHLQALVLDATFISLRGNEAILTFMPAGTPLTYTITGRDLSATPGVTGETILSGVLDSVRVESPTDLLVEIVDLDLDLSVLRMAALADAGGLAPDAVDTIVLTQDWTYLGTPQASFQMEDAVNADGVTLNMQGDDFVLLGEGNDIFWLGDGDDFALAGPGDDGLSGGAGDDMLGGGFGADFLGGGEGDDELYGGFGSDRLAGGPGNDVLVGDAGFDQLAGGEGNDLLIGGSEGDTFVFADGHGFDVIADFDPEMDLIQFWTERESLRFVDLPLGTVLLGNGMSVLILNTSPDAFDDGNVLLL